MRLKSGLSLHTLDRGLPKGFHSMMGSNGSFNYEFKKKHRGLRIQVSLQWSKFLYTSTWEGRRDITISIQDRAVRIRPMNGHPMGMRAEFLLKQKKCEPR